MRRADVDRYPRPPEGGVYRELADSQIRGTCLDAILAAIPTLAFDDAVAADDYGDIPGLWLLKW